MFNRSNFSKLEQHDFSNFIWIERARICMVAVSIKWGLITILGFKLEAITLHVVYADDWVIIVLF